ncbi:HlyB/MsbA family ABC transporter [Dichomitus squalens]|uniref:HlyB/MsbA family ABC transporter n=1 Tax=Dichomitus squalens TaxID=114155 RepID=A0A4Q9PLJ9_9APHY|nr:HlyB/MsbA family ABC transporter [Dichomitus squalens]
MPTVEESDATLDIEIQTGVTPAAGAEPYADRVVSIISRFKKSCADLAGCFPYVVRMFKDVLSIPGCKSRLVIYGATELGLALVPAASIWVQGHLLQVVEVAVTTRTVDTELLLKICAGRIACTIANMVLGELHRCAQKTLNARIRRWFAMRAFEANARLDVPTFNLPSVQGQLAAASGGSYHSVVWQTMQMGMEIASTAPRLGSQVYALLRALRTDSDGRVMMLVTLLVETVSMLRDLSIFSTAETAIAVTTKSVEYLKMRAWDMIVKYKKASDVVGDNDGNWRDLRYESGASLSGRSWYAPMVFAHIPQIAFIVRAARDPARLPEALTELNLVQSAATSFAFSMYEVVAKLYQLQWHFSTIRDVYEVENIVNVVPDGTDALSEGVAQFTSGVALEFRNVSFKYPGTDQYALCNVSFSLLPGQLCVIVGSNGAGKSTILKLAVRLYDPEDGQVLLGGQDVRTLKLSDLRQAISVLFQDYTHFPLSIRDNIALGDPSKADDAEHVRLAARLGGAERFVEKLPDGFDTYLLRPAPDYVSGPPEGNKTLSGKPFDVCAVRAAAGIKASITPSELSGGQMQRLAVARTFMRSVVADDTKVGLLLFDEPSASLDPAAEHDLFERLRELRGNETMVFSSHRFGNLTRHADLILYMEESGVVESGTHDDLLQKEGEYARLWKLQAQAFIS